MYYDLWPSIDPSKLSMPKHIVHDHMRVKAVDEDLSGPEEL